MRVYRARRERRFTKAAPDGLLRDVNKDIGDNTRLCLIARWHWLVPAPALTFLARCLDLAPGTTSSPLSTGQNARIFLMQIDETGGTSKGTPHARSRAGNDSKLPEPASTPVRQLLYLPHTVSVLY